MSQSIYGSEDDEIHFTYLSGDTVDAGAGNDTIFVSSGGNYLIITGDGDDFAMVSDYAVTVYGGIGNDTLYNVASNSTLDAGEGNDSIISEVGYANNLILGGGGDDVFSIGSGQDTIYGGDGNDSIYANAEFELISGDAGDDTITGAGSNFTVLGGDGNDIISGTVADGEAGNDTVSVGGSGSGSGGIGDDSLIIVSGNGATLSGGDGNDTLVVASTVSQNSLLDGGDGDDVIVARGRFTSVNGGLGTDRMVLDRWTSGLVAPATMANGVYGVWTVSGTDTARVFITTGNNRITVTGGIEEVVCFARGTRIATPRGEVPVEALRIGDLVVTGGRGAGLQPVIWVGCATVHVARHPDPAKVAPILVKAGALGPGVPFRDLRVSPDHALFLDGHLVPAKYLVNGTTIVQELWCPEVTYWHVEMPAHMLLVSDGALTESYLDDGNRKHFDNGRIAALFPDFESERANGRYDRDACYPVLRAGMRLEAIRDRIAAIATAPDQAKARRRA